MSASVLNVLADELPAIAAEERLAAIADHMVGLGTMATSDRSAHLRDLRDHIQGERILSTVAEVAAMAATTGIRLERSPVAQDMSEVHRGR